MTSFGEYPGSRGIGCTILGGALRSPIGKVNINRVGEICGLIDLPPKGSRSEEFDWCSLSLIVVVH